MKYIGDSQHLNKKGNECTEFLNAKRLHTQFNYNK